MLEIWHMHELNRLCHFVMGLLAWAKRKLEENWFASLSEAIMKVEGFSDVGRGEKFGFKKDCPKPKPRNGGLKVIALTTNLAQGECNHFIFLKWRFLSWTCYVFWIQRRLTTS
jgi:hypothetical protein